MQTQEKSVGYIPVRPWADEHLISPQDEKINSTIDQMTVILAWAIAGLFIAGCAYAFGFFSTPNERQQKDLETTQQQLTQTQSELSKIKACVGD